MGASIYSPHSSWIWIAQQPDSPPPVDLRVEKRNAGLVRSLIAEGRVNAVHDISEGGVACAAADMALASEIVVQVDPSLLRLWALLSFSGEDQALPLWPVFTTLMGPLCWWLREILKLVFMGCSSCPHRSRHLRDFEIEDGSPAQCRWQRHSTRPSICAAHEELGRRRHVV